MRLMMIAGFLVVSTLFGVSVSDASPILVYAANLDGAQAGVVTTATGQATVSVDLATSLLTLDVSWIGLSAGPTAMHIHCCLPTGPGTNQLAIPFPASLPTTGSFSRTVNLMNPMTFAPAFRNSHGGAAAQDFLSSLAGGTAYVDIPDPSFGAGEVRGTLAPVPEPATLALLGSGLGALAIRYRRRRAS